jgi:hypothetical protein
MIESLTKRLSLLHTLENALKNLFLTAKAMSSVDLEPNVMSTISAIFFDFCQFSSIFAIFVEFRPFWAKLAFFLKSNVMIRMLQKLTVPMYLEQKCQFFRQIFGQK